MIECVVRMEMPKNCLNCDLRYECNAFYAPGKHKPFMKGCMIICQLPENHGRLVDADVLVDELSRIKRICENSHDSDGACIADICRHKAECVMHTIVPATEEQKGEQKCLV